MVFAFYMYAERPFFAVQVIGMIPFQAQLDLGGLVAVTNRRRYEVAALLNKNAFLQGFRLDEIS